MYLMKCISVCMHRYTHTKKEGDSGGERIAHTVHMYLMSSSQTFCNKFCKNILNIFSNPTKTDTDLLDDCICLWFIC